MQLSSGEVNAGTETVPGDLSHCGLLCWSAEGDKVIGVGAFKLLQIPADADESNTAADVPVLGPALIQRIFEFVCAGHTWAKPLKLDDTPKPMMMPILPSAQQTAAAAVGLHLIEGCFWRLSLTLPLRILTSHAVLYAANQAVRCVFTNDLAYNNTVMGLGSASSTYPCCYCTATQTQLKKPWQHIATSERPALRDAVQMEEEAGRYEQAARQYKGKGELS